MRKDLIGLGNIQRTSFYVRRSFAEVPSEPEPREPSKSLKVRFLDTKLKSKSDELQKESYSIDEFCKRENSKEVEFDIQRKRVSYILDRVLGKLKLVAYFPVFWQNDGKLLEKYLSPKEFEYAFDLFKEIEEEERLCVIHPTTLFSDVALTKSFHSTISRPRMFDPNMALIIGILWGYRDKITELEDVENQAVEQPVINFMSLVGYIFKKVETMLYTTKLFEESAEKQLRRTYRNNECWKEYNKALRSMIEEQRQHYEATKAASSLKKNKMREKLEALTAYHINKRSEIVKQSEMKMSKNVHESEELQEKLSYEAREDTETYEHILQTHLRFEKNYRKKRTRLQKLLSNAIKSYDKEMNRKQAQYDEIKQIYNKIKDEVNALDLLIDEEEEIYKASITERKEDEEMVINKMAIRFIRNQAARHIQRYWRAYKARKLIRLQQYKKNQAVREEARQKRLQRLVNRHVKIITPVEEQKKLSLSITSKLPPIKSKRYILPPKKDTAGSKLKMQESSDSVITVRSLRMSEPEIVIKSTSSQLDKPSESRSREKRVGIRTKSNKSPLASERSRSKLRLKKGSGPLPVIHELKRKSIGSLQRKEDANLQLEKFFGGKIFENLGGRVTLPRLRSASKASGSSTGRRSIAKGKTAFMLLRQGRRSNMKLV